MTPDAFAARCRVIVSTMRGHEAHRALDFLTNDVLRALGYGEGIDIFESAVAHWHGLADPYPYPQSCPDCPLAQHLVESIMTEKNAGVERCGTCRFWGGRIRGRTYTPGDCHRYPPQITTSVGQAMQPVTSINDWCGEHQPAFREVHHD